MICVHVDDNTLTSIEFATMMLANILRLHSNLNEDSKELLETHIGRLRKLIDTAKEADDI